MDSESNGDLTVFKDENGRFKAGNPGKPKGAVVTSTLKIKKLILNFLELNAADIQESFDKLKPIEKLQFIANILPYAVPKMSQSTNETHLNGGINISWSEPAIHNPDDKGSNGVVQSVQGGLPDHSEPGGDQIGKDLHN